MIALGEDTMDSILRIDTADNVAVALRELAPGECGARERIPAGHKLALCPIRAGESVIKYGFPIGRATCDIARGDWVHVHNVRTNLDGQLDYTYSPTPAAALPATAPRSFMGYEREDGRAGIRNEIWIIPTVGCVNGIARALSRDAQALVRGGIDGITAFAHPYGCSQMGDDLVRTREALLALARHPNAGGVLFIGLGCETNRLSAIVDALTEDERRRMRFMVCQDEADEHARGMELLRELAAQAQDMHRVRMDASNLVIGLKCGGSDGFSGITANPVVGALSDRVIALGGSAVLTEVPEMFGAEQLLMNRCRDEATFNHTVHLINDFKQYFMDNHQVVYDNPSPGNKDGGITTLEDKSLGCTQKGGHAQVSDVLPYAAQVRTRGLTLLSAPGNDLVSATALAMSGCQMVLFTTGRGTPFTCPVPTVKIASNSALAARKGGWIDFDAGRLLSGGTIDALADELLDTVIAVASGDMHTRSEALDKSDLAIFKTGVTV